ncbi:hypothetical protein D0T25_19995 [Duganella sp. BJB488]|uniref:hypothetical protein n=1 Tax=unclassified Duganella TaxID=2636909 RepID=UPI000E34B011|nr:MULTISPECIES: hypothetical protein [unclassified Duganella]RFP15398.1 hypothetical protein D0T26_20800 [Duganella sp. BJB489]RFP19954.1 hypothetical protein D0T25_19995 [Duganella sp. BJB488]RFP38342.1 hypothetical protein D0T24_01750 [Duganella sp. BJB480]
MAGKHLMTAALLAAAVAALPATAAETETGSEQVVVINGSRSPEMQPYRYMLSGLDAFDSQHALAPDAQQLRFRLHAKKKAPKGAFDNLVVRLSGNETDIPVPLAEDHSFTLPRSAEAERDNADVVLNQKKSYYGWMPDVRSAGVPADMRRLGDIRLECRVLVAIAKNYIPFLVRATINTLMLTGDWCSFKDFDMSMRSDRAIASATLVDGVHRLELKVGEDGKNYSVPLNDKTYSNDALIEFTFE